MNQVELINGCIANDRLCQSQLYKQYFPFMSKIAIKYYDNSDDAVASINLAFLKLLKNLKLFDPTYALSTYLGKILINTILNDIKARNKFPMLYLDDENYEYDFSLNESEMQLDYNDLLKIIAKLPALHRNTFNLHIIDGYSHKEIAAMLNISVSHSKWMIHDARKRIMNILSEMNQSLPALKKVL